MRIKSGFMLRSIADNWIVVPIGERVVDFNGMITLNETGSFLWRFLEQGYDSKQLVEKLLEEFEVDQAIAKLDVAEFIDILKAGDLLEV